MASKYAMSSLILGFGNPLRSDDAAGYNAAAALESERRHRLRTMQGLIRIALRARKNKVMTGPEALVGAMGVAQQPIAPHGQILVHGELWQAESKGPIQTGDPVRVCAVNGLTLLVERIPVTQDFSH